MDMGQPPTADSEAQFTQPRGQINSETWLDKAAPVKKRVPVMAPSLRRLLVVGSCGLSTATPLVPEVARCLRVADHDFDALFADQLDKSGNAGRRATEADCDHACNDASSKHHAWCIGFEFRDTKTGMCELYDDCSQAAASRAPSPNAPQPALALFSPQGARESAGLAVCVTGQLSRLELRSKIQNLLAVHGPERVGLFLVLEKGDPVYVNAKTHEIEGGCDVEPPPDEVQEAVQPYLRGALFPEHKTYPVNMSEWPHYRSDLNGHGSRSEHEKLFHLQSHHAQFEHGQECARLMLEEEARTGKRYEAMVRVRDNGVVSARFSPLAITANAGSREVFAKDCNGWGGVSDKVLIVPRDMVESAFMHHFDMMSSILEGPPTAYAQHAATMRGISSRVTTSEKLLLAFLENANLTVSRLSDFIPVIDGRCFNATEPRHAGTTPDPAGKQWCAEPSCKDCNGSALPWDLDGFGFCNTTCDFLMPKAHPMDWADQVSSSVQNTQEGQRLERAPPPTS